MTTESLRNDATPAVRQDHTDYTLLAVVGILVAVGLVMVYSASFVEGFTLHNNQFYYLARQAIGAFIGSVALYVAWHLDYRIWRRFSVHFMAVSLVLLLAVLVLPTTMTEVNGSRSWIRLGGGLFSIQPAEIIKLALIIYFADWLSRRGHVVSMVGNVTFGLIPFSMMLGLVCMLIFMQPDLGTMVTIVMIAATVYFAAGANLLHVLGAAGLAGLTIWGFVAAFGNSNGRLLAFQDPWEFYHSYGYQPIHALYALSSGGIFGSGLGRALQKFQWLPQAHTDSIFAIIGEEFGLIGTLLILAAFGLLAYRGYRLACRTRDPFAALVVVGITSWLVFQALLNIAVTTSLLPFTGLTLPFISYGSTSLIMCMLAVGVLLSISRHPERATPIPQEGTADDHPAPHWHAPTLAAVAARSRRTVAALSDRGRHGWTRLPGTGSRGGTAPRSSARRSTRKRVRRTGD